MARLYAKDLLPPDLYKQCLPYVKCKSVYFNSPRKEEWELKALRVKILYGQGISQADIRRHLGISASAVYNILKREGLLPPPVKKRK